MTAWTAPDPFQALNSKLKNGELVAEAIAYKVATKQRADMQVWACSYSSERPSPQQEACLNSSSW